MNIPEQLREFWAGYEADSGSAQSDRFYEAFHFDDNEEDANALAALVLSGNKRATAGLLWTYEAAHKPLPVPGSLSVVTDWYGNPLCVIETECAAVVAFNDVSAEFAAAEGEGDGSLEFWRRVHWSYFGRECARIGRSPIPEMPVVCERFSVVYRRVS